MIGAGFIQPDWPAPQRVRALATTRVGGVSRPPFDSLNLGTHVGDDPAAVAENRSRLVEQLPAEPMWLEQVHGTHVVTHVAGASPPRADAAVTRERGAVCAVMSADCLPVLMCDRAGTTVAAAHAGWRGLQAGVLESTVTAMAGPARELLAWLGPAIGPAAFEVGDEVREAFVSHDPNADAAFAAASRPGKSGKWFADLYTLARLRLAAAGVQSVSGGQWCTVAERERFFSYRRDGRCGRQASLIWLDPAS